MLIELPPRYGSDGLYQDAKPRIICQSHVVHENASNSFEVLQTRWHPQSPTDSHLLVLLSDNSIRVFDESKLKYTWRIGPLPSAIAVARNLSFLHPLGDIAIDFDIAPPKVYDDQLLSETIDGVDSINSTFNNLSLAGKPDCKRIEWPVVILRGNGTVHIAMTGLNSDKPRLQGPLKMFPSKKDNYGDDFCSLLVIQTLPPTIVIAENRGILHHVLMVDSSDDDLSFDETKTLLRNEYDLFVIESIELELGLKENDDKETSAAPVLLKRDPVNEQRYYCHHETGLHGINIGFINQLQSYIDDESENEQKFNVKSKAEYILSTKVTNSSKVNAVVGVGIMQSPSGIFAMLSSGQVVSLHTIKTVGSFLPDVSPSPRMTSKDLDRRVPFDQHVRAILNAGVSQPLLKLDKTNPPTSQQTFELLMNTIQVLRDQYKRHDQVRQEVAKKCKILELLKRQQNDDIDQLLQDRDYIQEKALTLAEMHEDIMDRQQNLQKRVQDILRLALLRLPNAGAAEHEFTDQIKKIKSRVDKLYQDVKQVKSKHETQKTQLESLDITNQKPVVIPPKQEEAIKEILSQMTKQISTITMDVQQLSSVVEN